MTVDRLQIARECYGAYESGNREPLDRHLADDFVFFSPADAGIGRAEYFERCWPNAARIDSYNFVRLIESGDEVIVTYEARRVDGTSFRNTEVLSFAGEKVSRAEVYFGWDLPAG
jgi:ketosteroid isomerase-like protein